MKIAVRLVIPFACGLTLLSVSCRKKELDRDTAFRLVQEKQLGALEFSFADGKENLYSGLIEAHFIACDVPTQFGYLRCRPTSPDMRRREATCPQLYGYICALIATLGSYEVTGVSGVSQTGPALAEANLIVTFVPTRLFNYKNVFDQINANGLGHQYLVGGQGPTAHANFQLYDTGWQLTNIE